MPWHSSNSHLLIVVNLISIKKGLNLSLQKCKLNEIILMKEEKRQQREVYQM